ncbi:hypothetical protein HK100_009620 [Physocladia obscura]|uniref:Fibrous sheath-interacting protein 1 n=1 Tax=Physocladia obscura TaxID=109957 RepID=A0AAD5TB07_9FUNG|nr:hypothetical protein HK100_009620 [Physocladia obscura]
MQNHGPNSNYTRDSNITPSNDITSLEIISSEPDLRANFEFNSNDKQKSDKLSDKLSDNQTEIVLGDIRKRQEDWECERVELDLYLRKVRDIVNTGNATLISNELEISDIDETALLERNKHESKETQQKILDEFQKIKHLDAIIHEKTAFLTCGYQQSSSKHNKMLSKASTAATTLRAYSSSSLNGDNNATVATDASEPFEKLGLSSDCFYSGGIFSNVWETNSDFGGGDDGGCDDSGRVFEDGEDDAFELRSVRSLEFNTRTFLTEPKMGRKLGGFRRTGSGNSGEARAKKLLEGLKAGGSGSDVGVGETRELKGYRQGDFIQRNIVLGPQARFYHAMTEVEQDRVEKLLMENDIDDNDENEVEGGEFGSCNTNDVQFDTCGRRGGTSFGSGNDGSSVITSEKSRPCERTTTRSAKNTWLESTELDRLVSIDKELLEMHRCNSSSVASLVWTPSIWTPSVSGVSTPMYQNSSARDIKSVMEQHDINEQSFRLTFSDETDRLNQIDEQLRLFHERRAAAEDEDTEIESPERIEQLLDQLRMQQDFF